MAKVERIFTVPVLIVFDLDDEAIEAISIEVEGILEPKEADAKALEITEGEEGPAKDSGAEPGTSIPEPAP